MMLEVLGPKAQGTKVALLDVRNSKLFTFDQQEKGLADLLEGEALSFCRIYKGA